MSLCADMNPPWVLREEVKRLTAENERLRTALKEIAKPTYGTEFNMSDKDRADILGRHLFAKQDLARATLKETSDE